MDIKKLRTLTTLYDLGSYQETAELLFMTQSAVTKQIQSLERELDAVLVDRSKRQIAFTVFGTLAVRHAKAMLAEYEALLDAINGGKPIVRIASIPVMTQYGIIGMITKFRQEHPEIEVVIEEVEAARILEGLLSSRYDLAFARSELIESERIERLPLSGDRLAAVFPRGHQLAERESVNVSALSGETLLLFHPSTLLFEPVVAFCRSHGFEPRIGYMGRRPENIIDLVANGAGISLMMYREVTYLQNPHVAVIPLVQEYTSRVVLVRLRRKYIKPRVDVLWRSIADIIKQGD